MPARAVHCMPRGHAATLSCPSDTCSQGQPAHAETILLETFQPGMKQIALKVDAARFPVRTSFHRMQPSAFIATLRLRTCRYDVKYGSAGFNVFGYKGGCEMATGSFSTAIQAPNAARYLCDHSLVYNGGTILPQNRVCMHDYSSGGLCELGVGQSWDGFSRAVPVRPLATLLKQPVTCRLTY
jgi:hypothetical protein